MSEPTTLPFFASELDPGPSFVDLLRRVSPASLTQDLGAGRPDAFEITHATTVVAIR